MDVSFSGRPSDHIFEQEPGRPLEAFTGPFAEHVFGKSPEQLAMEEEEKSDETQADGQSSGVSNGVRIRRGFPSQWEKIAVSVATVGLGLWLSAGLDGRPLLRTGGRAGVHPG